MPEPVAPPQESAPSYEGLLAAAGLGTAAPPAAATAASLGTIATQAQVAQAVAALVVKMRAGSGDDHTGLDWIVNAVSPTFPDVPDKVVLDYVRGEVQREDAFWAAVETRLRRDLPGALQSKDPEAAIGALLERERRFIALHDEAAVGRVEGAVKLAHLQEVSPQGAYWRLDPTVVKHTPDCIAMAVVGWWPHAVLNKIAPPVHTGCRCHLLSHDEARAAGLMGLKIPDTSKALAKAEKIANDYGHLQESFWLNGDPSEAVMRWVGRVVVGARNSELDSAEESRISRLIQGNWYTGSASAAGDLELTEVAESPYADGTGRTGGVEHPKLDGKLDPLAIEEAYYDRRFAKGTVFGGRFMPKRGGSAPGIDINAVLHALLGSDAPHLRRRVGRDAETPLGTHVDRLRDSHGFQGDARSGQLSVKYPKSGAASPAVGASRDGTAGAEFRAVAAGVRERIDGIAKTHGAASNLGMITVNPERVDTEGWRSWSGDVEMGPEAQVSLAQMGRTHARGEQLQGDEAASAYHAVRATMHEGIHAVNPISPDLYAGSPSAYALEEALTEEMAHVHTVAYLREHGGQDVLRWLANASPNDIRAEGVYQPQRAGLAAILDEAQVPITARADLLDSLKFGTAPANREAVLAGLLSAKTGIPQSDALYSVRSLLESTASIDPIGRGGRVLVPDLPEAREAKIPLGASVKVQGRYTGKVTEVGTLSDGHAYVEVEVKGPDGPAWRYADPAHVEVTHRPTKQLKGDKIQGAIRQGDKAVATLPGGKELPVVVERVEPDDVLGWRATGRTAAGQVVTLRANSIDSIKKAKRKAATKPPPTPSIEGAKSELHVGVSKILDKATGSPAPVALKEVGGARAFDARHYQNPKRSLNAKLRALPKGETLHMADGTKVERGKHGSYLLTAPDGQRKRYAAPHRLSNAEIGTIESRHGLGAASPFTTPITTREKHIISDGNAQFAADMRAGLGKGFADWGGLPQAEMAAGGTFESPKTYTDMQTILRNPTGFMEHFENRYADGGPGGFMTEGEEMEFGPGGATDVAREMVRQVDWLGQAIDSHGTKPPALHRVTGMEHIDPEAMAALDRGDSVTLREPGFLAASEDIAEATNTAAQTHEEQMGKLRAEGKSFGRLAHWRIKGAKALDATSAGVSTANLKEWIFPAGSQFTIKESGDATPNPAIGKVYDVEVHAKKGSTGPFTAGGMASPATPDGASPLGDDVHGVPEVREVEPYPQIGVGLNGVPLHVGDDVSQPTNDDEIGVINAGNLWKIREDGWAVVSTEDGDVEVPADQLQVDHPANPESGMASPPTPEPLKKLVGKLLGDAETPGAREEVADSLHENPPEPVVGIPDYEGVELKDVKAAGGSNGARFAADPEGHRWLVKTYKGNRDRVATELLANAVYRDLGVRVPNAGSAHVDVPDHGSTLALTYPLVDGETRHWGHADAQLAKGFVADALLANWDVVGLEQDNVLWTPDDEPIRVDQGGTLAYRAMGAPKPFGPVPTELWTMNQPGGQAFGRMEITEPALRAEAKDAELRLTDARIDELVDAAGFTDENQREAVRAALKDRVAWLGEFGRGEQDLPKPNQGEDLRDAFADRDENLATTPDEDAALQRLLTDPADFTKQLTSGQKPEEAPEQMRQDIDVLDALLRDQVAALAEDAVIHVPVPAGSTAALGGMKGKFFTEPSYLIGDIDVPEGGEYVRVKLPRGAGAIAPEALESFEGPTTGAVVGARGLKLKVEGPGDDGIIDMVTAR